MLFNSAEFLGFLAFAIGSFHLTPPRWRSHCLAALSYLFYFSWSIPYAFLLLAVTAVAFYMALGIERSASDDKKKAVLYPAVLILVLVLGYFKYFEALWKPFSGDPSFHILVPIGISYYTFKLISYVVDVYWEKIPAEKNLIDFIAYVSFFPQILSGPIQRAADFLPQIKRSAPVSQAMLVSGLQLILFGFFKKLVIADRLAYVVNHIYADPGNFNSLTLLLGCYGFMIQLYADFSGLTDIAIGTARLFGFNTPKNFDSPFLAANIQMFWRKWHMTLTQWLADYLFSPLRMSFRQYGTLGLVACIMINMCAIGLWHGASGNYLAFGILHGIFMSVSVLTLKARDRFFEKHTQWALIRKFAAPVLTFHLVVLASVFFRAESISQGLFILKNIVFFDMSGIGTHFFGQTYLGITFLAFFLAEAAHYCQTYGKMNVIFYNRPVLLRWGAYYALVLAIFLFGQFRTMNFIYFEF